MKKTTYAIIAILIVLTLVSVFFIFNYFFDAKDEEIDINTPENSSSVAEEAPSPVDADPPSNLAIIEREESYNYSEEILSPNTIAENINDFVDRDVTTRGWIIKTDDGTYRIISINSDEKLSLIVASSEIEFNNYLDPPTDPSKQSTPVTVQGKIVFIEDENKVVLSVSRLEE